jgi:hypothetical protein
MASALDAAAKVKRNFETVKQTQKKLTGRTRE